MKAKKFQAPKVATKEDREKVQRDFVSGFQDGFRIRSSGRPNPFWGGAGFSENRRFLQNDHFNRVFAAGALAGFEFADQNPGFVDQTADQTRHMMAAVQAAWEAQPKPFCPQVFRWTDLFQEAV